MDLDAFAQEPELLARTLLFVTVLCLGYASYPPPQNHLKAHLWIPKDTAISSLCFVI
jgi:hypothetical protein